MTSAFLIRSCMSDYSLRFVEAGRESFTAELSGAGLSAVVGVSAFEDLWLPRYLRDLASQKRPWQGAKSWESMEGELQIEATCSSLGEVRFEVRMWHSRGSPEQWSVSAGVLSELGQLPAIARDSEQFFSGAHT
jgi:hypothetical protein